MFSFVGEDAPKPMKKFLTILLIGCCSTFTHSGGTNAKGGHHDRKNGSYHFHHGMKAHDYPMEFCPFAKKDSGSKAEQGNEKSK